MCALPIILAMWFVVRGRAWRHSALAGIVSGFVLVVFPFGVYVLRFASDVVGQLQVYGDRGDALRPGFWLENVRGEPERYAQLVAHWPPVLDVSGNELSANALSPWLLVVGILPAIAFVAWRSRNATAIGNRMLLVSLIGCGGLLLLLDQTKTSLYAILLLPSVCMALAAASVTWVGWGLHQARTIWRRVTIGSVAGAIAVCIALEGAHAYQVDWLEAASVTPYLPLGAQIDSAIAPDTVVLGPERWWWVLREHPYVSLRSTWFQWAAAASAGGSPQFADWVIRTHPATIIVNVNVRGDVRAFPQALQDQFWAFIDQCTTLTSNIHNPNYFDTEVYEVTGDCEQLQAQ